MSGTVALTYDDGPDPIWTELLLTELREHGARATFFVMTPQAVLEPGLIESMLAGGHEVALHCQRHVRHSELSEGQLTGELATALRQLASVGVTPRAWRAPWGVETDTTRSLAGPPWRHVYVWDCSYPIPPIAEPGAQVRPRAAAAGWLRLAPSPYRSSEPTPRQSRYGVNPTPIRGAGGRTAPSPGRTRTFATLTSL